MFVANVLSGIVVLALWCLISESAGLAPEARPVEERRVRVSAELDDMSGLCPPTSVGLAEDCG